MEWSDVFTEEQKASLLNRVVLELQKLIEWLRSIGYKDEVEVAGFYGTGDKLVIRDGVLFEKYHSYDDDLKRFGKFFLKPPVLPIHYSLVILRYEVSLNRIDEVRRAVEKKQKEVESYDVRAVDELRKLVQSSAIQSLVRVVPLVGGGGDALQLDRSGLVEILEFGTILRRVGEDEFSRVVSKYRLSSSYLSEWRNKIERKV